MSGSRAAVIEARLRLLELEAAVQRATLGATFAEYGERRGLAMGSAVGAGLVRLLALPRIRWLVIASVLARLKKARERRADGGARTAGGAPAAPAYEGPRRRATDRPRDARPDPRA